MGKSLISWRTPRIFVVSDREDSVDLSCRIRRELSGGQAFLLQSQFDNDEDGDTELTIACSPFLKTGLFMSLFTVGMVGTVGGFYNMAKVSLRDVTGERVISACTQATAVAEAKLKHWEYEADGSDPEVRVTFKSEQEIHAQGDVLSKSMSPRLGFADYRVLRHLQGKKQD